jgi:transcriptional regulator with XRE-family HTH domain
MPSLIAKIKDIRSKKRLTQETFSKSLGYSRAYIADIESGRTRPSRKLLETISQNYDVSIDWLLSDNQILSIIESNKKSENPDLIFGYAFTQEGIDRAEKTLKESLRGKNYIFINASTVRNFTQFLKMVLNEKEGSAAKLQDQLKRMMLNNEVILIIRNMSLSKIPKNGWYIKDIFKILDDAWVKNNADKGGETLMHLTPKSSLIVLDFPSYLEKNMDSFGYYAVPIYLRSSFDGRRK